MLKAVGRINRNWAEHEAISWSHEIQLWFMKGWSVGNYGIELSAFWPSNRIAKSRSNAPSYRTRHWVYMLSDSHVLANGDFPPTIPSLDNWDSVLALTRFDGQGSP